MRQRRGLEVVFSIFLGILVTAFVGVGVYTFYPPSQEYNDQLQELYRERRLVMDSRPLSELTPEEREQIREIDDRQDQVLEASRLAREIWGRTTSIVLIAFATLAMAISLVRADQLPVISSGLLLGGVLTMLYGVGWIVATDTAMTRFIVIAFALLITLILGYMRFVRRRSVPLAASTPVAYDAKDLADIEQRLKILEQRINQAANALGQASND